MIDLVQFILSYSTMVKREREQLLPSDAELPFVSILAPAYCEAACVKGAMRALVRLDYPAYEVIFVDDGSTDDTYQLTLAFAGTHKSARNTGCFQIYVASKRIRTVPVPGSQRRGE